jgi:hypothetical protein
VTGRFDREKARAFRLTTEIFKTDVQSRFARRRVPRHCTSRAASRRARGLVFGILASDVVVERLVASARRDLSKR